MFNHGGATAEKPGEASIIRFSDAQALTNAVKFALQNCEYRESFDYGRQNRVDWPAFQASGYKSVSGFESAFIRLEVRGVNNANLYYDITSPEFARWSMRLTVTVDAASEDFGAAVQFLIEQFQAA